ncbi:hypothetical protein [Streptomyces sp. R41]|uniref:Uncharacterized protein n=1 Tax=Streptomyces sp. R41 TaxID=3238632 RepID=A0AB39RDE9_9ACTN
MTAVTERHRQSGGVRLIDGEPWEIEITEPGEAREPYRTALVRAGDPKPRGFRRADTGPFTPTYADLDHTLGFLGLVRGGPERSGDLEVGKMLELFRWYYVRDEDLAARRAAVELALSRGVEALSVTLPVAEAGQLRQALLDTMGRLGDPFRTEELADLAAAIDAADGVRVLLPVLQATHLPSELRGNRYGEPDEEVSPELNRLAELIEQGQFTSGRWQSVRQPLRDALRDALSLPGAEGLAARDELLDVVERFARAHRSATRADDTEQQRLQALLNPAPEDAVAPPAPRARRRWSFPRR